MEELIVTRTLHSRVTFIPGPMLVTQRAFSIKSSVRISAYEFIELARF
jgi:hypothetical protein